jgi:hypothetical protein
MMYPRWIFLVFLSIAFTLLAWIAAPVLPIFSTMQMGACDNNNRQEIEPRLPAWLSWFMTPDNSLWGDGGWRTEHCPDWNSYWGMVKWLFRNPGYGFEWNGPLCAVISKLATVSFTGDTAIQNGPHGKEGYCFTVITNPDGTRYWHLYLVKVIGGGYCLNINLGWKLKTYAEDPERIKTQPKAMFCFSPRVTSFVTGG